MLEDLVYCGATQYNACGAEASTEPMLVFPDGYTRLDTIPDGWKLYRRGKLAFTLCPKESCRQMLKDKPGRFEMNSLGHACYLFVPTGPLLEKKPPASTQSTLPHRSHV